MNVEVYRYAAPHLLTLAVTIFDPSGSAKFSVPTALLDTGATDCFISHAISTELALEPTSVDAEVTLPDGRHYTGLPTVDFNVKASSLEKVLVRGIVLDLKLYPLVLGMTWFNQVQFHYRPSTRGWRREILSRQERRPAGVSKP